MAKSLLLAISYIRKSKGQAISFFVIICIASILMLSGFLVGFHYNQNFDTKAKESNAASSIIMVATKNTEGVEDIFTKMGQDTQTKQVEMRDVMLGNSSFSYGDGSSSRYTMVLNKDDAMSINKVSYFDTVEGIENPVYLPYLYHTGGSYMVGDSFTITFVTPEGGVEKTYTVAGFFEETFLATINTSTCGIILEEPEFQELMQASKGYLQGKYITTILEEEDNAEAFNGEYQGKLNAHLSELDINDSTYYELISRARTVTSSIGAILIVAFSIVITSIALVVVYFHIGNTIEEEMRNIGVLKAIGYTSQQIIHSLVLQFLLLAGVGSGIGTILTYLLLPQLSAIFASQTGVIWKQGIDPIAIALCTGGLLLVVISTSHMAARKIHKVSPITAIRKGINTHSFKRNVLPLEKYNWNITSLLAGKLFLQRIKQNSIMAIVILIIGFASVFATVLYYNTTVEEDLFLNLVGGEIADIQMTMNASKTEKDAFLEDLRNKEGVEKAFYYDYGYIIEEQSGNELIAYICDDFDSLSYSDMLYQGRFPKHDNEIALGGLIAQDWDVTIGDEILVRKGEMKASYLVTGFIQGASYMGQDSCLTSAGYKRLMPDFEPTIVNLYLQQEDIESFKEEIESQEGDTVTQVSNVKAEAKGELGVYQSVVQMLVIVIALVTMVMVTLILYLVIKATIIRSRKELGIQKALGYTNRQLMLQIIGNFLPILIIGVVLGIVVGEVITNPILSILFSGLGMVKVHFVIPTTWIICVAISIVLLGLLVSYLVAYRIRRITPCALFQ